MLLFYALNDSRNSFLFSFLNDTGNYRGGNNPGFVLFFSIIIIIIIKRRSIPSACAAQLLIWRPPNAFESP